jgi:uncharacterized membrane protein YjjP (DUF1212 family)
VTLAERSNLVAAFARVLYVNGQSTDQTLAAAKELADALELRVKILPRWGELFFQASDREGTFVSAEEARPTGVDMDRVASARNAIEDIRAGRLVPAEAAKAIQLIAQKPPAPTWLFALAAAACAVALAVLFGVRHSPAAALIFVSGGAGGVLRRILGRYSSNIFLQPFSAALIAGIIGALAVRFNLSSALRLVAVCPCMVLVPGPHFLNGMIDLVRGRMVLGTSRLIYASLVVAAISVGLLAGLALFGVALPVDPPGRELPLWHDVIAAGVAVACYSIFFSIPLRMLPWPVTVGAAAHALRWVARFILQLSFPIGAFVACLVVGLVLTPVARRRRMPFAAIGFASVVSMMPGVFLFRTASGLVQLASGSDRPWELMAATFADGSLAVLIILAMSFGLIVPKLVIDYAGDKAAAAKS